MKVSSKRYLQEFYQDQKGCQEGQTFGKYFLDGKKKREREREKQSLLSEKKKEF